jgi:hypothetical protein
VRKVEKVDKECRQSDSQSHTQAAKSCIQLRIDDHIPTRIRPIRRALLVSLVLICKGIAFFFEPLLT